jgi:hypothetical protein
MSTIHWTFHVYWDSGNPLTGGRGRIHPCGWWAAIEREGEPLLFMLIGAEGKPHLIDRHLDGVVDEFRRAIRGRQTLAGHRIPVPPRTGRGTWARSGHRRWEARVFQSSGV